MTTATDEANAYVAELARWHPRLIRTEEEADAVRSMIHEILQKRHRTEEDREFLAFLSRLLLIWEDGRYEPIKVSPLEILKSLLEENGLRQQDLVGPVFPTKGVASEVLSGKRRLTYDFVERLAAYFHVSPALFYPSPEQQAREARDDHAGARQRRQR
jgi:HTH-type transcriptional regulator/antitoxin HigA